MGHKLTSRVNLHDELTLLFCLHMQGKCTFGPRLTDEEVQQMAQYVLEQAANNWQAQQ
jgi:hypothetical protein